MEGSGKLSDAARAAIEDLGNDALLSIASLWEIAIKVSLGKLVVATSINQLATTSLATTGIEILDIHPDHIAQVSRLPFHDRDPFDRMIISQALVDRMTVVSVDSAFDPYSVARLW